MNVEPSKAGKTASDKDHGELPQECGVQSQAGTETPCCCCSQTSARPQVVQEPLCTTEPWIIGTHATPVGDVPQVDTRLHAADHLGAWRVRWGIGRMRYRIAPGLYAVGRPTAESPVLVSANYKISFDRLRSQLVGQHAWILVLDTHGVNVWCAAGKGTFSTDEIVGRVKANRLEEIVSHRTLIVPQLGAPGVAAHQVKNRCGFRVVYGPVRAADLPTFLANGMKATPEMREVAFSLWDRLVVVPVELVGYAKFAAMAAIALLLLAGLGPDGYAWPRVVHDGIFSAMLLLATYFASNVLGPALLPWLPGRALSLKGVCLGLVFVLGLVGLYWFAPSLFGNRLTLLAWGLAIPAIASFLTMTFTGSTTYTSLSGVRWEMRIAVPMQLVATVLGAALWIVGRFV